MPVYGLSTLISKKRELQAQSGRALNRAVAAEKLAKARARALRELGREIKKAIREREAGANRDDPSLVRALHSRAKPAINKRAAAGMRVRQLQVKGRKLAALQKQAQSIANEWFSQYQAIDRKRSELERKMKGI